MKIITRYWNNIREIYDFFPQSSLLRERPLWSEVFRIAFINKMVTAADGCTLFRSAGSKHQTQLQELCGLWKAHFVLYIKNVAVWIYKAANWELFLFFLLSIKRNFFHCEEPVKKVYNDIMDFHGIIKDSMKQFFETVFFFYSEC